MDFRRALGECCLVVLVAASASSCIDGTPRTEPLMPAVVPATWETILLAHPRRDHTATGLADGSVLVAGGNGVPSMLTTDVYEPSVKIFTSGPQLPGRYSQHAAAPIAEGALFAGGTDASIMDLEDRSSLRSVGPMMLARQNFSMTPLLDGTVLVSGGAGRGSYTVAEIYDPQTRRFARTGDILVKRFNCPATLLKDGRVLLTGGTSSSRATYNKRIADAEIYDPVARSFTRTGSMQRSRSGHTSTLLADGRVLITGGINEEEGFTTSAELYDPKNGVFREISPMRLPRSGHAAVLLADGRVLITGGFSEIGTFRSAEIFDPALENFLETEPMGTARRSPSATLLKTGEVLIVGGWGASSANSAELFRLGR